MDVGKIKERLKLPELNIGNLKARIPIIQGGMGVGISLSNLASAVANEGGVGVISSAGIGMHEADFNKNFRRANLRALRSELQKARRMTEGIIGVNILVACSDFNDLLRVSIEEGADIVFLGAGLPLKIPREILLDEAGRTRIKVVPIVSSARAARIIFKSWQKSYNHVPDAVVVEGPMAGGHLGFKKEQISDPEYALEKILPQVIAEIKPFEEQFNKSIPVIAAGGVYSGADIYRFIQMGAQAVQMATRFVATNECDASAEFKEAYIKCRKEDLVIIDSPVGLPGRAIKNRFLEQVASGLRKPFKCPWQCLRTCDVKVAPYCICSALTNAKKGRLEKGFSFAGANAYLVDKITTVKELIESLLNEYREAAAALKVLPLSGCSLQLEGAYYTQ
jgi:NAD(P)H-dependent flavin oxidoreductase YrpB (nitropropane dioxygenase family)